MSLHQIIKKIEEFLVELQVQDDAAVSPSESGLPFIFSRKGRGTMTLTAAEASQYRLLLDSLRAKLPDSRRTAVALRTLGEWFQDAIFVAVVGEGKERIVAARAAAKALLMKLEQPPKQYHVYLPLHGVAAPRRARRCGPALVRAARSRAVAGARRDATVIIAAGKSATEVKADVTGMLREEMDAQLTDRAVAELIVTALDAESAERRARDRLREVTDVINFFAVLLIPREITAFASIDGPAGNREKPLLIQPGRSVRLPVSAKRKLIDLDALFTERATRLGTRKAFRMMVSTECTPLERRTLSAIIWIGHGNSRPRSSEALVDYLISLEALLLGPQNDRDISYKLRLRCAHVIASSAAAREQVFSRLGALYSVRSKIVHAGFREIDDNDLSDARFFAQRAALEVLHGRRFGNRGLDLEARFLEMALGGRH